MEIKAHDQFNMKYSNLKTVFRVINSAGNISRADIAKVTKMSPTSITRLTGDMASVNLIYETLSTVKKVGRTAALLEINGDFAYTISVNIDSSWLHVSILDFCKRFVGDRKVCLTQMMPDMDKVVDCAYEIYRELIDVHQIPQEKVVGLGISIVGAMADDRILAFSPQLNLKNVDIYALFQRKFEQKLIVVENDCNCAVLGQCVRNAEYMDKAVALISLCTGVGSSLCINGELPFRSSKHMLSEIGHTTVDPNGMLCECGRSGCLQTYLAESYLVARARAGHPEVSSIQHISDAWHKGETWAKELMKNTCRYIQMAINNVACMYSPQIVLLGGSILDEYEELFEDVDKSQDFLFKPLQNKVVIKRFKDMTYSSMLGVSARVQSIYLNGVFKTLSWQI